MKKIDKKKQGKKNKASGAAWELKVRKDMETCEWFVSKFQNNVEFGKIEDGNEFIPIKWKDLTLANGEHYPHPNGRMIPAKRKYNQFSRAMTIGTGFPDFICWQPITNYDVIGVEAKSNGYLDKEEREKCKWLLENKVFSIILIAKKKKEGRKVVVEYVDFKKRYK